MTSARRALPLRSLGRRARAGVVAALGHGFGRSVAVLAGGTAAAQLINVAMSPVVTRLYEPADVGRMGLYLAFVNLAAVLLVLRFDTALVSARSDREAAQLAAVGLGVLPLTAAAAAVGYWGFVRAAIGGFGTLPESSAILMALSLALVGVITLMRYWFVRTRRFGAISQSSVAQSLSRAVAQLVFGLGHGGWFGLLVADLTGDAGGVTTLSRAGIGELARAVGPLRELPARRLLRRYWKFPVLSMPSSFLDAFSGVVALPLVAHSYGVAIAGQFFLVQTVLGMPAVLVGSAVADAFHGRIAQLARDTPHLAPRFFARTAGGLLLVGLPIAIGVMALGPWAFTVVFGSAWTTAGMLAVVLAPSALAGLVVSPLSRVVFVYHGLGLKLAYDLIDLVLVVGSLTLSVALGMDVVEAVAMLSVAVVVSYLIYLAVLVHLVRGGPPRADDQAERPTGS